MPTEKYDWIPENVLAVKSLQTQVAASLQRSGGLDKSAAMRMAADQIARNLMQPPKSGQELEVWMMEGIRTGNFTPLGTDPCTGSDVPSYRLVDTPTRFLAGGKVSGSIRWQILDNLPALKAGKALRYVVHKRDLDRTRACVNIARSKNTARLFHGFKLYSRTEALSTEDLYAVYFFMQALPAKPDGGKTG